MPFPFAAIASALPALFKAGQSIDQSSRAKKLRNKYKRPTYKTPNEVGEATGLARQAYNNPDIYAQALAEQRLQSSAGQATRDALQAGGSGASVLGAIAGINKNQNRAMNDLSIYADRQRERRSRTLANALYKEAGYKDSEYFENKKEPYVNAQNAASALSGAARQNAYGAVYDVAQLGSGYLPDGTGTAGGQQTATTGDDTADLMAALGSMNQKQRYL